MKRMLSRFVIASGVALVSSVASVAYAASAGVPKPDAKMGEQLYVNGDASRGILACASCHGAGGNSTLPANPNLASLPYEYLVGQLIAFTSKDGTSPPPRRGEGGAPSIMTPFASALTLEDKQNVAYYLSMQKLDYDQAATAGKEATMERGQHIWRGGLPDRRVPACAGCHAPNGAGIPAAYPRLAGQFPDYIAQQLRLFRDGERNNNIMQSIADRMTDADIAAVSDYAAGLR